MSTDGSITVIGFHHHFSGIRKIAGLGEVDPHPPIQIRDMPVPTQARVEVDQIGSFLLEIGTLIREDDTVLKLEIVGPEQNEVEEKIAALESFVSERFGDNCQVRRQPAESGEEYQD